MLCIIRQRLDNMRVSSSVPHATLTHLTSAFYSFHYPTSSLWMPLNYDLAVAWSELGAKSELKSCSIHLIIEN